MVESTKGGVKGTEEDTKRSAVIERKRINCGEVVGWRVGRGGWGGFNDDNAFKSAEKCPYCPKLLPS